MPRNLFSFASKELSQDAILAWLMQWADPIYEKDHPELFDLGIALLQALVVRAGGTVSPIEANTLKVDLQWNKVDILLRWHSAGKQQVLVIEDKVHAQVHGNQLERYRKGVEKSFQESADQILLVFLKTTFTPQQALKRVEEAGYSYFSTPDLYAALAPQQKRVEHGVVQEFWQHLEGLNDRYKKAEEAFACFASVAVQDWTWWHWYGFMESQQNQFSAGILTKTVRRSTFLAFYFGHASVSIKDGDGPEITYKPYADLLFEVGKKDQTAYHFSFRLALPPKDNPNIRRTFRDRMIRRIRPILEAKGLTTQVPRFSGTAKETIALLKIGRPAASTHHELLQLLEWQQEILGDLPINL